MEKVKVHELAKQYGLTNMQMMDFLANNDIEVQNPESLVDISFVGDIIKKLETKKNLGEHRNKTSLKSIQIEGLFGKYNYKIEFKNDIFIWVSENGVGKTTILNIIVALLNADRKTLAETYFKKVVITIDKKPYVIDKTNVKNNYPEPRQVERLLVELRAYIPARYFVQIRDEYRRYGKIDFEELDYLIRKFVDRDEVSYHYRRRLIYRLRELQEIQFDDISDVLYEIKSRLMEEILFYPTYRRIEISLDKVFINSTSHSNGELIKYIGFGMEDVKRRISNLLDKMSKDANNSYIEMNGAIISDLLKNSSIAELAKNIPQINRHKVEVVIKRIGEERIENIDKLKEFVNGKMDTPNEDFLIFYLDKLAKIYDSQKAIDDKLSNFAKVCTKYLSGKKVIYDEAMLSLDIFDIDEQKIDFDDLSSGEKQIVSIFSKVYLDVTTSSIFVIDEPEISLSIEWQKEFLVDVYNSGKVALLIATTHSPFIFKNEFREFTTEIDMYKEEKEVDGIVKTNGGRM